MGTFCASGVKASGLQIREVATALPDSRALVSCSPAEVVQAAPHAARPVSVPAGAAAAWVVEDKLWGPQAGVLLGLRCLLLSGWSPGRGALGPQDSMPSMPVPLRRGSGLWGPTCSHLGGWACSAQLPPGWPCEKGLQRLPHHSQPQFPQRPPPRDPGRLASPSEALGETHPQDQRGIRVCGPTQRHGRQTPGPGRCRSFWDKDKEIMQQSAWPPREAGRPTV